MTDLTHFSPHSREMVACCMSLPSIISPTSSKILSMENTKARRQCNMRFFCIKKLTCFNLLLIFIVALSVGDAFSSSSSSNPLNDNSAFSLSSYQKARALETSQSLDASRLHFQILFVDDDNAKGRIAEGLLARTAEYNDAMFVLFPASSTLISPSTTPDATAPSVAVKSCHELGLCPSRLSQVGTAFDVSYLDEYDLVIAMDDDIQSRILRSLTSREDQKYYGPKCRLLSEFLSVNFCQVSQQDAAAKVTSPDNCQPKREEILLSVLDLELASRAAPFAHLVTDTSSDLIRQSKVVAASSSEIDEWRMCEAALILASAGITRFCLDTMDVQFENAFQTILERNFYSREHAQNSIWNDATDDRLRACSYSVTGYFSPNQRQHRFERHMQSLRDKLL